MGLDKPQRPFTGLVRGLAAAMLLYAAPALGGDWPTWRHDAQRTAATPHALPQQLHLQWVRELAQPRPAWPASQTKLRFDESYEPVVLGHRLFVGSNANDSVTAYDTQTGQQLWRFYTDGPVRFAPVAQRERVWAVSDDGYLYCLDARTGKLLWKVNGGPTDRPIIGNDRLVSSWVARGGPVLADGVVYIATSIWPSMGIFIHAVDAETGEILWTNSETGSDYTVHPHGAPSFGSIVPQGYLVVSGKFLLVPGGRSLPAVFDRQTGEVVHFEFGGKASGGFDVFAGNRFYFVRGEMFRLSDGLRIDRFNAEVLGEESVIGVAPGSQAIAVVSTRGEINQQESLDRRGRPQTTVTFQPNTKQTVETTAALGKAYLLAGDRVYTASESEITAFELQPTVEGEKRSPVWSAQIDGDVWNVLAADDRLFVVTKNGRIYCFGQGSVPAVHHALQTDPLDAPADAWSDRTASILEQAGTSEGYAVVLGVGSGRLIDELLRQSNLHVIAVDDDSDVVDRLRRRLDAAGLYGTRVAAHVGRPRDFPFPPYVAKVVAAETLDGSGYDGSAEYLKNVFEALRPYGGAAFLPLPAAEEPSFRAAVANAKLANAGIDRSGEFVGLRRIGPLPGSGQWSHQYADAANSVVSEDRLVKVPLGVLWFGGPSNDKVLPRHGHGPSPQVAGGRLFIEGPDMLRAVDVYTGRLLWERELEDVGKYYDITSHFPGAGEIGSNYVSMPDAVYVVYGSTILELDAATGELNKEFELDAGPSGRRPDWGFASVWQDLLVATSGPVTIPEDDSAPRHTRVPEGLTALIKPNAKWQYLAGSDPQADWTTPDYQAAGWSEGEAGFGFADNDDRTILRGMRGKFARVYARTTFNASAAKQATEMALMLNYDDAFIAYLNGTEIARVNVGSGSGKQARDIRSHEAEGHELFQIQNFKALLRPGRNVLAVEGHNSSTTSGDFTLDPYLIVNTTDEPRIARLKGTKKKSIEDAFAPVRYSSASRRLVVFNRHTSQQLWSREADYSFRHNCVIAAAGKIFCIDGMSPDKIERLKRRGITPSEPARLLALDAETGRQIWSTTENFFGTFLNYSREHDVLLQAGSKSRDRAEDEIGRGMIAYRGSTGEVLWKNLDVGYAGPCLVWRDKIITNGNNGFQLELLTGERTGWSYSRMYGCNTIVGSENLLTFRSGAAGFCDLAGDSGTGNIGGFRSSCTSNLIAADGVLSAPDYTRTCICAYQNQCSLALIHMPGAETWTFNDRNADVLVSDRLGINLGAPGDRRSSQGTLWLEYPSVGGPTPQLEVQLAPEAPRWFTRHSSLVGGEGPAWVTASGAEGIESLTATLPGEKAAPRSYTVRLYFADPADDAQLGQRVFTVLLQGEPVLENFDPVRESGAPQRGVVKQFHGVRAGEQLAVALQEHPESARPPVLCGVEIVAEGR